MAISTVALRDWHGTKHYGCMSYDEEFCYHNHRHHLLLLVLSKIKFSRDVDIHKICKTSYLFFVTNFNLQKQQHTA